MSEPLCSPNEEPHETEDEDDLIFPFSVPIMIGLTIDITPFNAGNSVTYTVTKTGSNLGSMRVSFASYPNNPNYPPVCDHEVKPAPGSNTATFTHTPVYTGWPYPGLFSIIVIESDNAGTVINSGFKSHIV